MRRTKEKAPQFIVSKHPPFRSRLLNPASPKPPRPAGRIAAGKDFIQTAAEFSQSCPTLAGNRVIGGCSWLTPLRSEWANEKQVVSVELPRHRLHRELFALLSLRTFFGSPLNVPDTNSESRRDGVKVAPGAYPFLKARRAGRQTSAQPGPCFPVVLVSALHSMRFSVKKTALATLSSAAKGGSKGQGWGINPRR
jgi:hypothetical protein